MSCIQKKRMLLARSVDNWISEYDKQYDTATWLTYKAVDRVHVESLSCSGCTCFQDKLLGMCNYKASFIEGSRNLRTSSIKDHAVSNMHIRAMSLLKQERVVDLHKYAPIAKALSSIDEFTHKAVQKKFEIA